MNDTPFNIELKTAQMIAKKTPFERLKMAGSLFESGKIIMKAGLLDRNPGINQAQLRTQMFLILYSEDFTKPQIEKILKHLENVSD